MSKTEHSPLPWRYEERHSEDDADRYLIWDGNYSASVRRIVANSFTSKANAQFIVTACNSYYDNQQAIAELVSLLGSFVDYDQLNFNQQVDLVEHAERLIAKHKAKP